MSSVINKTYPINVPAGESLLLPSGGTYVYCTKANLSDFHIAIDDVLEGACGPGLGYERDADEEPFANVRIVNKNGSALVATIVIGTGHVLDNRLTLNGVVQVEGTAAPAYPVQVGERGLSEPYSILLSKAAVVGQSSRLRLENPAASGVILEVISVEAIAFGGGAGKFDEQAVIGGGASGDRWNFASVASAGRGVTDSTPGAPISYLLSAAAPRVEFPTPVIVTAGRALVLISDNFNVTLDGRFVWREWPA